MTGRSAAGGLLATVDSTVPLQVVDPSVLAGTSSAVRAAVAFAAVLLLGGAVLWRYEPFVERSQDASMAQPLRSTVYGVAAHLVVGFAGVILAAKLAQYTVAGWNPAVVGLAVGVALLLAAGSLGFTVVGSTVVELGGGPNRWAGLVVGAGIAGVIAVLSPTLAWAAWVVVGSAGVGGAVRKWVHASAMDDLAEV